MPVVSIDGSNDVCTTQAATPVQYHATTIKAAAKGSHRVILTSDDGAGTSFASVYIHKDGFDPANSLSTCIAADNSDDNPEKQRIVEWTATKGTTYVIVIFDDTFGQTGGAYSWTLESPTPFGSAKEAAVGAGKRFVKLPDQIRCDLRSAVATWKLPARRVAKAVFKANFKVVARPTRIKPGKAVVMKGIPATATKLTANLTLKSGRKVSVSRKYWPCI